MHNLITNHIDVWTAALENKSATGRGTNNKQTAYGIKKLRELILELAVRGKLVPQDPNDEPASVLLEKIAEEKTRLVKEGKIKKPKALTEIDEDEKPFELPDGWEWVRVGDVCVLENGDRSKNYPNKSLLVESGIPFVNAGHLQNGRINRDDMTFITEARYNLLKSGKFSDGDILFCLRGSLGKSAIIEGFDKGAIASSLVIIRLFDGLDRLYLHNYFDSPFSYRMIKLYDNGTAQPNLSATDLGKFLVPLPPPLEQHRIVAKVDELMALCDQLEQQQTDSIAAHQTLVETLLKTLTDSENAEQLAQNWAILSEHFDTLFTTDHSIAQLKQTIQQLAVMGKLVPQIPSEESAAVLLGDHQIFPDSVPWNLPVGWAWSSFGMIGKVQGGGTPRKTNPEFWNGQIPWVSPKDMKVDVIEDAQDHISEVAIENSATRLIPISSLLIVVRGMILAHSFPTAISSVPLAINQDMKAVTPFRSDLINMLLLLTKGMKSEILRLVQRSTHGTCKLLTEELLALPIPIPPLDEQHRIVAKVDELMALCDQLQTQINKGQTTQIHLADAIVEQAIA
ncbi:restriction endonuclease subunit S [Methylomarinum vadi]|uniref:restriction endonuclease subunit S n=1 Tax=Methylomarinum vadi TaxID=438855 RepID=UPI0004DECDCB|nr:restriction endonuclease subunit S [Methylomarinum vadi]